jgi:hypothetical protein
MLSAATGSTGPLLMDVGLEAAVAPHYLPPPLLLLLLPLTRADTHKSIDLFLMFEKNLIIN